MIKSNDPLLFISSGNNFMAEINVLVQPCFMVTSAFIFFSKVKLVTTVFASSCFSIASWKVSTVALVFSGCDSRLAGGPGVVQAWPLPSHTHASARQCWRPAAVDRVQLYEAAAPSSSPE